MVLLLFCDLLQDDEGNPKPENKWPSEEKWKRWFPWLVSHSSNELETQKQQVGHQLWQRKIEYNISCVLLFLEKKTEKKTFRLRTHDFCLAFQEFTYYKLKLTEQEMCFISQYFPALVFFSSRDFIKTESNQNSAVEYKSY